MRNISLPPIKTEHFGLFIGQIEIASITAQSSYSATASKEEDIEFCHTYKISVEYAHKHETPPKLNNIPEAINYITGKLPQELKPHIKVIEKQQ